MRVLKIGSLVLALAGAAAASAAPLLQTLTSFGGGDGYLAPGDRAYLTTDNTQRGLAYNAANDHVYLANRAGGLSVRVLNGTTGADVGTLDVTGITGGTFALSTIGVAGDGAIYGANLTTNATTSNLKIYRWANEAAAPTVAFVGDVPNSLGARWGDSFAVRGSGAGTEIVMGAGSVPAGFNSFAVFRTADGVSFTGKGMTLAGPANGAFRLGLDFGAGDSVWGKQVGVSSLESATYDFGAGAAARIAGSPFTLTAAGESPLAVDAANSLLATVDINSSLVRLYRITGGGLTLINSLTNLPGASVANGNGVGALDFGGGRLYVLNTNNGIQAFEIPEPAALALLALGGLFALRRR